MMRITVSNVTALSSRLQEVASWEVDATILVETRLTRQGQRALTGLFGQRGWQVFWGGGALPSKSGGVWDAWSGGVAIIVKMGTPAQERCCPRQRQRTHSRTTFTARRGGCMCRWQWGKGRQCSTYRPSTGLWTPPT